MFNEIIVNLLELVETRVMRTREYMLNLMGRIPNFLSELMAVKPLREPMNLVAVDSGFTEIHYLGLRFTVVNTVTLVVKDGRSRLGMQFNITNAGQDEVEDYVLNLELRLGVNAMKLNHADLLLLDGPLSTRDRGLISNGPILAHVKDVHGNKYSQAITDNDFREFMSESLAFIEEPLIMYLIMEYFRKHHNDNSSVLVSKPFTIWDSKPTIMGFYVQYTPGVVPIYVEYVGGDDPLKWVARVAPLAVVPRLGYPAPLYIVDRVSRVNEDVKSMVRLVLEKLGGDALRELRGVYFSRSVNDYVKGIY
ncbi:DNA double-strand break repair nuclease NurA [Vulcanisaeta thermophila]|uniref:DNA double-strand break repair nuclease NurA n=1 Tax=Vulcanisaeta thermophila TaxID=867917 RepID=UPI000853D165|nr:DNA double-strand break repair nuclease NurA [Vulcanisaeta thermophila]